MANFDPIPAENTDPWYEPFTDWAHSVEQAVEDVEAGLGDKADTSQITVLGVIDHDETPPSPGVWLRRPAPEE